MFRFITLSLRVRKNKQGFEISLQLSIENWTLTTVAISYNSSIYYNHSWDDLHFYSLFFLTIPSFSMKYTFSFCSFNLY